MNGQQKFNLPNYWCDKCFKGLSKDWLNSNSGRLEVYCFETQPNITRVIKINFSLVLQDKEHLQTAKSILQLIKNIQLLSW